MWYKLQSASSHVLKRVVFMADARHCALRVCYPSYVDHKSSSSNRIITRSGTHSTASVKRIAYSIT